MNLRTVKQLSEEGRHEVARLLAGQLAAASPANALLQYEAACLHQRLSLEPEAAPLFVAALAAGLPRREDRDARLSLGRIYRALGRHTESLAVLDDACTRHPKSRELQVFRAVALQQVGRSDESVAVLLRVIAATAAPARLRRCRRAIVRCAEDVGRE